MRLLRSHGSYPSIRCLNRRPRVRNHGVRCLTSSATAQSGEPEKSGAHNGAAEREAGAMSRRLQEMTEAELEEGGKQARKALDEAGFSRELIAKLEGKIADANFRDENASAFARAELPSSAGRGTQEMASAQAWTGNESLEDAALRMLDDARKPLRGAGPPKTPQPRGMPGTVDFRIKKKGPRDQASRIVAAKDQTSRYAISKDPNLTEEERAKIRLELKERFTPGARPMPATVRGLAALANERIEDAIARGQFKNIKRGKGENVERDHNANSPFLDTTEYFMNKIIQKQEIVPPWIEKQQELVKEAAAFRARLRSDWKRHATRMIASRGGTLEQQVQRARAYAAAEEAENPRKAKVESLSGFDQEGRMRNVSVTETPVNDGPEDVKITVRESPPGGTSAPPPSESKIPGAEQENTPLPKQFPRVSPFRDPDWERLELSYHQLALTRLNRMTRSYNLMAPDLAKKPYLSLERELKSCFADVAPLLPNEILERAKAPSKALVEVIGHSPGGVLERLSTDQKIKVYESKRPQYGFREFWRDLWGKQETRSASTG